MIDYAILVHSMAPSSCLADTVHRCMLRLDGTYSPQTTDAHAPAGRFCFGTVATPACLGGARAALRYAVGVWDVEAELWPESMGRVRLRGHGSLGLWVSPDVAL